MLCAKLSAFEFKGFEMGPTVGGIMFIIELYVKTQYVIPNFHRRVNEIFAALRFYAVLIGFYLPTSRDTLTVPCSTVVKINVICCRNVGK